MNLKKRFRLIGVLMYSWLITAGSTAAAAVMLALIVMSWVVTIGVVFELDLPYKFISVLAVLSTTNLMVCFNIVSSRNGK